MILFFFLVCPLAFSHKILVYNPKVAHSHIQFIGTLADILQDAGHQVTVLQPEFTPHVSVNGSKLAKIITVKPSDESWENRQIHDNDDYWEDLWNAEFSPTDLIHSSARMLNTIYTGICRNLLTQTDLIQQLKAEKFDVAIVELLDFSGLVITHFLDIPAVIGASSLGILEGTLSASGMPLLPSFVPASHGVSSDSGSIRDRFINIIYSYYSNLFQESLAEAIQKVANEELENPPKLWNIVANMPLILTNSDPLLDFARPTLHKIVDLGGITVGKPQKLSAEMEEILSRRPKTVVISFGTIVFSSKMPKIMKDALLGAIERFPDVTFLWKYEEPKNGPKAKNLVLLKWIPQSDLLADPRVKLFITHGGIASTFEGAARGVPMIFVPNFGDQMRNSLMIERLGFGSIVRKCDLRDETALFAKIEEGLTNIKMREAANRTKIILENRPFSQRESLVRHVELVSSFNSALKLSPNSRNFSVIQYYNLDIFVLILLVIFTIAFLFHKLILIVCNKSKKIKMA